MQTEHTNRCIRKLCLRFASVTVRILFCIVLFVSLWIADGVFREKDLHGAVIELLLNAPRANALAEGRLVSLHRHARELGIDFLDLNEVLCETGVDNRTDYHDTEHLNVRGAAKATRYIGRYIQKCYGLTVNRNPEVRTKWDALCVKYDRIEAGVLAAAEAKKGR